MSTRKTREFLEYYVKNAPGTPAASLAREALAEVEAIERAAQLAAAQVAALLDECRRRAVLDPADVIDGLERLERIAKESKS